MTTAISHYTFAGLRIAVKRGSTLYHMHGDHLGSTAFARQAAPEALLPADPVPVPVGPT